MASNTNLSSCGCNSENEKKIHVHCPCEVCEGMPVNRMKAWRHAKRMALANGGDVLENVSNELPSTPPLNDIDDIGLSSNATASGFHSESILEMPNLAYDSDRTSSYGEDTIESNCSSSDDENVYENTQPAELQCEAQDDESNDVREFIRETVLKLVHIKTKSGFSIKTMEDLLKWGKDIFCKNNIENYDKWPSSWEHVRHMLEEIGYNNPKLYFICLNSSHPCLFGIMESKNELCPHCGNPGKIPYYYLSVVDKVIRWFSSPEMCKKMSAHWNERVHWLSEENREDWGHPIKKQIWDGKQFSRLHYFWNPECEWVLPTQCPFLGCKTIISAESIMQSPFIDGNQDKRRIHCPSCFTEYEHEVIKTRGDPRNLAYDVHWDGWQPFSCTRGSGAIELQVATMTKENRCSVEEVYVVGFVPTYLLPNKCPIFLDPFLEPLINDIETGFIKGINVHCSVPMCGKREGPAVIRHLILCFSGDHNGICEAGKFIKMGKCACRRCKLLESVYIPQRSHYYYTNFRKQCRFPSAKKSVIDSLDLLYDIEEEERVSIRKQKARDSGYTGLSILHRLYPLYGFLYDEHMVYDEMHTFSLNIVKSALLDLLTDEDDQINWDIVDERLNNIPWTTEFKSSRYPKNLTRSVKSWKAEEFSIFAYPIAEVVFDGLLTVGQREEWMCLARMIEFIKNHARNGWTKASSETFHAMCHRYAVLLEERQGPQKCVIILHNLLHIKDDIENFSGLDNFSCWTKERAVRRYISQSSNCKNIEATFASTEVRRECFKVKEENKMVCINNYARVDADKVWAKTIGDAKELYKTNPTVDHEGNGILVGASKQYLLPDAIKRTVAACCGVQDNLVEDEVTEYRSVLKPKHQYNGLLYRRNEHIVVSCFGESVVLLKVIFIAEVEGEPKYYCTSELYKQAGFSDMGARLLQKSDEIIVCPLSQISRKVMLAKYDDIDGLPTFILLDFMRRIFPIGADSVVVPYYPVANDMVLVMGRQPDSLWRARVLSFNIPRKVFKGQFFTQRDDGLWIPEATRNQEINFDSVMGVANGIWQRQFSLWRE